MIRCPACGFENAATSHFCRNCGTALKPTTATPAAVELNAPPAQPASLPQPAATPTAVVPSEVPQVAAPDDAALQAQLIVEGDVPMSAAPDAPESIEPATHPTQPLTMPTAPGGQQLPDPVLAPGTKVGDYTVVELRDERAGQRIYRAEAPRNVCQVCGTRAADPEARFCEECGAELVNHQVLLFEREIDAEQPEEGPWRLIDLPDDPIRSLLPPITVFEANNQRYLVAEEAVPGYQSLAELLATQGDAPQQPAALDENDALPLSLQLARLLDFLHRNNTALGDLSLAQLLIGPKQVLRLRDASQMTALNEASRKADLAQLVRTLEDLTRTPRLTQRLDNGTTSTTPTLDGVLGQGRMGAYPDAAAWVTALEAIAQSRQAVRILRTSLGTYANVGRQRQIDEDSFLVQETKLGLTDLFPTAGVYVVADGMGGHEAGEVASRLAVLAVAQTVAPHLATLAAAAASGESPTNLEDLIRQAAEAANLAVFQEAQRRSNDMGTTLTFAIVVGDRCVVGNVGDSRTYLLRAGQLQRISKDHSLVMRLVEVGQITEDEIYTHPHRSAILRSLGEKPQVEVDLFPLRIEPGDALFLCSDGQWEMVRNPRINELLNAIDDPQTAVVQLVDEANRNGGEDNITAVLVRFEAISDQ